MEVRGSWGGSTGTGGQGLGQGPGVRGNFMRAVQGRGHEGSRAGGRRAVGAQGGSDSCWQKLLKQRESQGVGKGGMAGLGND